MNEEKYIPDWYVWDSDVQKSQDDARRRQKASEETLEKIMF